MDPRQPAYFDGGFRVLFYGRQWFTGIDDLIGVQIFKRVYIFCQLFIAELQASRFQRQPSLTRRCSI